MNHKWLYVVITCSWPFNHIARNDHWILTFCFAEASEFPEVFLVSFLDPSWAKYPKHPEAKLWGKQVVDVDAWFKILTFLNHTNVVSQFHQIFAKWQWCFWKHSLVGCGRTNFVFISGLVTAIVWFESLRVASCVRMILWGAWNGVTSNLSAPLMTHLFGSSLSLDLEARSKNREIFQCLNQWNQTHPWPLLKN